MSTATTGMPGRRDAMQTARPVEPAPRSRKRCNLWRSMNSHSASAITCVVPGTPLTEVAK